MQTTSLVVEPAYTSAAVPSRPLDAEAESVHPRLAPQNGRPREFHQVMLVLAGPPGSGKSTLSQALIKGSSVHWVHANQDTVKGRSRKNVVDQAHKALLHGANVIIDRCNTSPDQRKDFVALATETGVKLHAVVLLLPLKNLFYEELNSTKGNNLPSYGEGFDSVMTCTSDEDVRAALQAWIAYTGISGSPDTDLSKDLSSQAAEKKLPTASAGILSGFGTGSMSGFGAASISGFGAGSISGFGAASISGFGAASHPGCGRCLVHRWLCAASSLALAWLYICFVAGSISGFGAGSISGFGTGLYSGLLLLAPSLALLLPPSLALPLAPYLALALALCLTLALPPSLALALALYLALALPPSLALALPPSLALALPPSLALALALYLALLLAPSLALVMAPSLALALPLCLALLLAPIS
eukprot:gene13653-19540_t